MNGDWEQVAPGVWRLTKPIDPKAASALMRARLASRWMSCRRCGWPIDNAAHVEGCGGSASQ